MRRNTTVSSSLAARWLLGLPLLIPAACVADGDEPSPDDLDQALIAIHLPADRLIDARSGAHVDVVASHRQDVARRALSRTTEEQAAGQWKGHLTHGFLPPCAIGPGGGHLRQSQPRRAMQALGRPAGPIVSTAP